MVSYSRKSSINEKFICDRQLITLRPAGRRCCDFCKQTDAVNDSTDKWTGKASQTQTCIYSLSIRSVKHIGVMLLPSHCLILLTNDNTNPSVFHEAPVRGMLGVELNWLNKVHPSLEWNPRWVITLNRVEGHIARWVPEGDQATEKTWHKNRVLLVIVRGRGRLALWKRR